jgi:hypothetical protein
MEICDETHAPVRCCCPVNHAINFLFVMVIVVRKVRHHNVRVTRYVVRERPLLRICEGNSCESHESRSPEEVCDRWWWLSRRFSETLFLLSLQRHLNFPRRKVRNGCRLLYPCMTVSINLMVVHRLLRKQIWEFRRALFYKYYWSRVWNFIFSCLLL